MFIFSYQIFKTVSNIVKCLVLFPLQKTIGIDTVKNRKEKKT